jgi:hypothetical protein
LLTLQAIHIYSNISHARIAALQENDKKGNEEDKSLLKKRPDVINKHKYLSF